MAPPREIPGFYYDEAKGKFFKIEARSTAPTAAPWSAENVKKRARRDRELLRESKRGRTAAASAAAARPPIRRSVLAPARGSPAGDALRLEFEGGSGLEGGSRGLGDARGRVWAAGLRDAGAVRFGHSGRPRIESFAFVTGDVERLGYAYAMMRSRSGSYLVGQYIPTDDTGRVCFDVEKTGLTEHYINGPPEWMEPTSKLSSVGYNPHKKLFFTSCQPAGLGPPGSHTPFVMLSRADPLMPHLHPSNEMRLGLPLYGAAFASRLIRPVAETYTSISAPHNSPLTCLVGTDSGVVLVRDGSKATLMRPTLSHGPVFALDCSALDPNLVLSAGRRGVVVASDIRAHAASAASAAPSFRHGTTATHLRIAPDGNQHTVLVAGVSHTMALYDRRWLGRSVAAAAATPVVTFPDYRNEARVNIGWDVCRETGVVVAAEGRGTVGLYSVFSGRRVGEVPLGPRTEEEDPVACLRVATVEGEALPSVFVAAGGGIAKFSCSLFDE